MNILKDFKFLNNYILFWWILDFFFILISDCWVNNYLFFYSIFYANHNIVICKCNVSINDIYYILYILVLKFMYLLFRI